MAALSAIFGSAAYYSANDKVAGLDLKASSEASPFTSSWSYENVTLDVTVASSTIYSSSAQKMAEVTVTSSGIPQDIVEYANDQVSAFSESHIDMFSLSTNVIKYTVGTDAAPEDAPTSGTDMDPTGVAMASPETPPPASLRRRMRADLGPGGGGALGGAVNGLPMSGPGELKTRKQGTMSQCTSELKDDVTQTYSYTYTLPHSSDTEFGSGIKAVYQGIFQSYKEVRGQVNQDPSRSTALVLGSYDITAGSNVITLKVHPLSTDQSKSYWWMSAEGDNAKDICTSAATYVQVMSYVVAPSIDDDVALAMAMPVDAASTDGTALDGLEPDRSPPTELAGTPVTDMLLETTSEDSAPLDSLDLDRTSPPGGVLPSDAPEAPQLLDASEPSLGGAPTDAAPPTGDAPQTSTLPNVVTLEDLDSSVPCTTTKTGRSKYIMKCLVSNLQATAGVVGGITTALEGLPHAL